MKVAMVDTTSAYDIGLYYAEGRKKIFSQDYFVVENLLTHIEDFSTNITGEFLTNSNTDIVLRAPGIEITGEFYRDSKTGRKHPLWYNQIIDTPVDGIKTVNKSITYTTSFGEQLIILEGLIEAENEVIVNNNQQLFVNGNIQSKNVYWIDHSTGTLYINISSLVNNVYTIEFYYSIVLLGLSLTLSEGKYSLRAKHHYENMYFVNVLYSNITNGTINFQSRGESLIDSCRQQLLYREVEENGVEYNTYTYHFGDSVKFPIVSPYAMYSIRPKENSGTTIVTKPPMGLLLDTPWFLRFTTGRIPSGWNIPEIEENRFERPEIRTQIAEVITIDKIKISSENISANVYANRIEGIDLVINGSSNSGIYAKSFNQKTMIITLSSNIPLDSIVEVTFTEIIDWYEYDELQLNPSIADNRAELLNNYILIYHKYDGSNRSIYHTFLPIMINGVFMIYEYDYIKTICNDIMAGSTPVALIRLIETLDEDYYQLYDIRTLGGYNSNSYYLTDVIEYDGDSIDLSGNLFTMVGNNLIEKVKKNISFYEPTYNDNQLTELSINKIVDKVHSYTRIGMKNRVIINGVIHG